jgi:aminobenzoyl-glutamate utilization protein B
VLAGAKVVAMTVLDLMTTPKLVRNARAFQQDVQFKDAKYDPLLTLEDQPAITRNKELMNRMRPQLEKFYYDPSKYPTYLEQLGIRYPHIEASATP